MAAIWACLSWAPRACAGLWDAWFHTHLDTHELRYHPIFFIFLLGRQHFDILAGFVPTNLLYWGRRGDASIWKLNIKWRNATPFHDSLTYTPFNSYALRLILPRDMCCSFIYLYCLPLLIPGAHPDEIGKNVNENKSIAHFNVVLIASCDKNVNEQLRFFDYFASSGGKRNLKYFWGHCYWDQCW